MNFVRLRGYSIQWLLSCQNGGAFELEYNKTATNTKQDAQQLDQKKIQERIQEHLLCKQ